MMEIQKKKNKPCIVIHGAMFDWYGIEIKDFFHILEVGIVVYFNFFLFTNKDREVL